MLRADAEGEVTTEGAGAAENKHEVEPLLFLTNILLEREIVCEQKH